MIWGLLGLFLVLVLLALALTKENVGISIPLAAAVVIGIIASLAWYQNHKLKLSKQSIPAAEVELADMQLMDEARGVKSLSGRIRNHSQNYTLVEVGIQVSMEDCIDQHCEVINQTEVTLRPDVPPGQARDFREQVAFQSELAPRGKPALKYKVTSTRGE